MEIGRILRWIKMKLFFFVTGTLKALALALFESREESDGSVDKLREETG